MGGGTHLERARDVLTAGTLGDYALFGLTQSGQPKHPLYLPGDSMPFNARTLEPITA